MTGNTAQAILDDSEWIDTLQRIYSSLKAGGYFIFETREPSFEAWTEWNKEKSFTTVDIPGKGTIDSWVELQSVRLPHVSFKWTWFFHDTNATISSDSTIVFRSKSQLTNNLSAAGFSVEDIREAPDRPAKEMVFVARKRI